MAVSNGEQALWYDSPVENMNDLKDMASEASRPKKLHGRAFYESLGSPRFVLAPMVDQSEFAWRLLTRSFMTPTTSKSLLAYTPMLHSRMFNQTPKFRDNHFQPLRTGLTDKPSSLESYGEKDLFLDGNPAIDRPLVVQFCANDPSELLEAATYVAPFCDAVDLNLGCPQGIARKGKYGAFLQEDQDLIYKLINNLHVNLSVPVTAKIRILETKEKTLAYAKRVLDAGASVLTVHGRQRDQKGHKTGLADWGVIRYLRENLPKDTVLFANGNILRREDIQKCLEATGADAVMSAEGNLYDPAIFGEIPPVGQEGREYWRGRDGKGGFRTDAVMRRYMDIMYGHVLEVPVPVRKPLFLPSDPPTVCPSNDKETEANEDDQQPPKKKQKREKRERATSPSLLAMQPHLFRLLRPLVAQHHHIRDALAKCVAGDICAFERVLEMVENVIKDALIQYETETDEESIEGDLGAASSASGNGMAAGGEGGGDSVTGRGDRDREAVAEQQQQHDESSVQTVRECWRPWWICQPYVRPLPREALEKGSLTLSRKEKEKMAKFAAGGADGGVGATAAPTTTATADGALTAHAALAPTSATPAPTAPTTPTTATAPDTTINNPPKMGEMPKNGQGELLQAHA